MIICVFLRCFTGKRENLYSNQTHAYDCELHHNSGRYFAQVEFILAPKPTTSHRSTPPPSPATTGSFCVSEYFCSCVGSFI